MVVYVPATVSLGEFDWPCFTPQSATGTFIRRASYESQQPTPRVVDQLPPLQSLLASAFSTPTIVHRDIRSQNILRGTMAVSQHLSRTSIFAILSAGRSCACPHWELGEYIVVLLLLVAVWINRGIGRCRSDLHQCADGFPANPSMHSLPCACNPGACIHT